MSIWPVSVLACESCGCPPDRRSYGSRGYCRRCLYYVERREAAKGWRFEEPSTYAKFTVTDALSRLEQEKFEAFRRGYLRGLQQELGYLVERERCRSGKLENLDLEYKFGELRKLAKSRTPQPRNASFLSTCFSVEEMAVIYTLLDEITEEATKCSDRMAIRYGYDAVHQLNLSKQ